MRVGVPATTYAYQRNVIGAVPGAEYRRVRDVNAVLGRAGRGVNRLLGRQILRTVDLRNRFDDFGLGGVDLYHFINAVSFGTTPWVTTFETFVPRLASMLSCHHGPNPGFEPLARDPHVRRALEAVASDSCRRVIAMSDCAERIERDLLRSFPDLAEAVASKLVVLHPPQAALLGSYAERPAAASPDEITFLLVGTQFFSKGGVEVVDVLTRMRHDHGYPIRLTVVSSMVPDDYVTMTTPADAERMRATLDENPEWIAHHESLPNANVLELMRRADVGLLPAHAETYGYVALEFQAAGCPVVTTDIRALPEINSDECGWVVPVPKNRLGEAIYTSPTSRVALAAAITDGLEGVVHGAFADRSSLARKGAAALARVQREHSSAEYGQRLAAIYSAALG